MGLAVSVLLDVRSVRPNQPTRAHLVVVLSATRDADRPGAEPRPPLRTILAIDASRSMHGEPLDHAKRSVDRMLDMFSPDDEVGVVAFSDNASEVSPPMKLDEAGKRLIRSRVNRLTVSANTNIDAGLSLAATMMSHEGLGKGPRKGVVLLSDGAPNRGAYTADGLREVVKKHRPGISFFALGYGKDHSEDILSAIGEAGGGGYEYVPDPASCSRAFARALGAQADVVATGIELVIGLADGVELARFVSIREETRFAKDGVIVTLPDMVAGARRVLVAEISVAAPGAEKFLARIADVSVRARTGSVPSPDGIDAEVADRDPVVDASGAREVLLARADVSRDEARRHADSAHFDSAARLVRKLLAEIERCPGFVLNDGSALAEAYEQLVDEAVAYERKPNVDEYAAFRKTNMGRLTMSAPESARDRGPMSLRYMEEIAGDMPEAYLVVGDVRHRLREENVIGRTQGADVVLGCAQVTRRHAGVNAIDGKFYVVDFGSTNTTEVNGVRVGMKPQLLKRGDVIRVGTVELRYEEA